MSEATRKMQDDVELIRSWVSAHEKRLMQAESDIVRLKNRDVSFMDRMRWLVFGK